MMVSTAAPAPALIEELSKLAALPTTLAEWQALLPPAPKPVASYVPAMQHGNLVFTAGILPMRAGQLAYAGKVGSIDTPLEHGVQAAQLCVLNGLSVIVDKVGSLENIAQIVKVTGFVNSAQAFTDQPKVINGASDLLVQILGSAGQHARSAVGVAELPLNASVEIEFVVALKA